MLLINPKMPIAELMRNGGDDDKSDNDYSTFWYMHVQYDPTLSAKGTSSNTIFDATVPFHMTDKFKHAKFCDVDPCPFAPELKSKYPWPCWSLATHVYSCHPTTVNQ